MKRKVVILMNRSNYRKIRIITDVLIIILELLGVFNEILRGFELGTFQFYTTLSNYFALIVCTIDLFCQLKSNEIPEAVSVLKFMATVCLTITFLVVLLVFGGMSGNLETTVQMLWMNDWKYRHLMCPLIMMVDNMFFEKDVPLPEKVERIAILPTLLYAVVAIIMNLLRVWNGPYPFLYVYDQPWFISVMWFVLIVGGSYIMAILLKKLRRGKK